MALAEARAEALSLHGAARAKNEHGVGRLAIGRKPELGPLASAAGLGVPGGAQLERLDELLRVDAVDLAAVVDDEVDALPAQLDGWVLRAELEPSEDGPVVVGIELRPGPGAQLVGSRVLRRLGFGAVIDAGGRWLTNYTVATKHLGERWASPVKRPGRGRQDSRLYARWAARYVRALAAGDGRPVKRLVEEAAVDGEHVTEAQVRAYLTRARRLGLLTAAEPGRGGGELTALGRKLALEVGEVV